MPPRYQRTKSFSHPNVRFVHDPTATHVRVPTNRKPFLCVGKNQVVEADSKNLLPFCTSYQISSEKSRPKTASAGVLNDYFANKNKSILASGEESEESFVDRSTSYDRVYRNNHDAQKGDSNMNMHQRTRSAGFRVANRNTRFARAPLSASIPSRFVNSQAKKAEVESLTMRKLVEAASKNVINCASQYSFSDESNLHVKPVSIFQIPRDERITTEREKDYLRNEGNLPIEIPREHPVEQTAIGNDSKKINIISYGKDDHGSTCYLDLIDIVNKRKSDRRRPIDNLSAYEKAASHLLDCYTQQEKPPPIDNLRESLLAISSGKENENEPLHSKMKSHFEKKLFTLPIREPSPFISSAHRCTNYGHRKDTISHRQRNARPTSARSSGHNPFVAINKPSVLHERGRSDSPVPDAHRQTYSNILRDSVDHEDVINEIKRHNAPYIEPERQVTPKTKIIVYPPVDNRIIDND